MIVSVEEFRTFVDTDMTDPELEARLLALEMSLRKYTNNNFQQRNIRYNCPVVDGRLYVSQTLLKEDSTIEISQSLYNDGVYTVKSIDDGFIDVYGSLIDECEVLVTRVVYPPDVKMGVVDILRWIIRNAEKNSADTSKRDVQSETISRHSVTYAQDATEADIDVNFGCPKKYMAFMNHYKKARF